MLNDENNSKAQNARFFCAIIIGIIGMNKGVARSANFFWQQFEGRHFFFMDGGTTFFFHGWRDNIFFSRGGDEIFFSHTVGNEIFFSRYIGNEIFFSNPLPPPGSLMVAPLEDNYVRIKHK